MILVNTDFISGKQIETMQVVKGSVVQSKHLGKDIMAGFRGMVGGEITEYTKMMAEAREQSLQRMTENAEKMGANAIVAMRFGTAMVMQNAAEVIAYGTAVVIE